LPSHRNPGLEIVYVSRGHLLWQAEGRIEAVSPGSVFFTLPHQEHGSVEEFEPGHNWHFIVLAPARRRGGFLPDGLGFTETEARTLSKLLAGSTRHAVRASARLQWILPVLVHEMEDPGTFHAAMTASLARAAVIELARSIADDSGRGDAGVISGVQQRLRAVIDRVAREPGQDWTLAGMASAAGLARSQFAKRFLAETGDTPGQFVARMRIRRARRFLRETDWPVTRIAIECGFGTSQYFSGVFKKFTGGLTAREYRCKAG
jgi:AraC-like DNA-binding protein